MFHQSAREPGATRTGYGEADQLGGLGRHLAEEWSTVPLAGAKGAEGGARSTVIMRDIGDCKRIRVDIPADAACARLRHGGPPRGEVRLHHQAARVSGKRPCVPSGGNLPSSEVIMSIVDEAYMRESILYPNAKIAVGYQAIMPTFQGQISEEGLLQIIAYIRSLSGTPH